MELAEPFVSPVTWEFWKRPLMYVGVMIVLAIIMVAISFGFYSVLGVNTVGVLFVFVASVMCLSVALGYYEKWRGCHFDNLPPEGQ